MAPDGATPVGEMGRISDQGSPRRGATSGHENCVGDASDGGYFQGRISVAVSRGKVTL